MARRGAGVRRRRVLKAAGAVGGAVGVAGCYTWVKSGGDVRGSNENAENESEQTSDEPVEQEPTAEGEDQPTPNESAEGETETTNETDTTGEDDSTRPEAEAIEDADAVETEHEAIRHEASVEVRGAISNTSSGTIDQVSVEVVMYDADGGEMFREVDGTIGLVEGDTWSFSISAEGTDYADHVKRYDLSVTAEQHQE